MTNELMKICLPIEDSDEVENVFARRLANGNFVLDNIPFYAYGISCGDEFSVTLADRKLCFNKIEKKGGHSTYRVKLRSGATHEEFLKKWPFFESQGCGYEGSGVSDQRLYSIDIPPRADIDEIYALLVEGERDGFWEFEEGHYSPGRFEIE